MPEIISIFLLFFSILAGGWILIRRELLSQLLMLAILYLLQAIVFYFQSPALFSIILVLLGWMATAAIGATRPARNLLKIQLSRPETIFYLLAYIFAIAAAIVMISRLMEWFPSISAESAALTLISIFQGIIITAYSKTSHEVIIGLLVFLIGFETMFLSIEISLLVIGLLGAVKLGLAFIASYWMESPTIQEDILG
jgi:hypothetical protein